MNDITLELIGRMDPLYPSTKEYRCLALPMTRSMADLTLKTIDESINAPAGKITTIYIKRVMMHFKIEVVKTDILTKAITVEVIIAGRLTVLEVINSAIFHGAAPIIIKRKSRSYVHAREIKREYEYCVSYCKQYLPTDV